MENLGICWFRNHKLDVFSIHSLKSLSVIVVQEEKRMIEYKFSIMCWHGLAFSTSLTGIFTPHQSQISLASSTRWLGECPARSCYTESHSPCTGLVLVCVESGLSQLRFKINTVTVDTDQFVVGLQWFFCITIEIDLACRFAIYADTRSNPRQKLVRSVLLWS